MILKLNLRFQLGLAVPVLVKPEQCADSITPSDMSNSWTCAWSGGFIVVGGCSASMWSKYMHRLLGAYEDR